jgi:hypothetical protein
MPREAEPGVVQDQRVRHAPRLDIDDRDRRFQISAVCNEEIAAVGGFHHRQREAADLHVLAGRRDFPAVRQQGHAATERAGPHGRRDVAEGERQRAHHTDDKQANDERTQVHKLTSREVKSNGGPSRF